MEPITREEMYLAAAAGYNVTPPEPITRKEIFLAQLAGMEVETPAAFTRQEMFLEAAAMAANRSVIEPLAITENGTYNAPNGVDGYNPVVVNVDQTKITIIREREISGFALDDSFGYAKVESPPPFTLENGEIYYVVWDGVTYETTAKEAVSFGSGALYLGNGAAIGATGNNEPFIIGYMESTVVYSALTNGSESHTIGIYKKVRQEILLQDKIITENGEYTADSGFDGLGNVTVEVAGSGGGLPAGGYWRDDSVRKPTSYQNAYFVYKGKRYFIALSEYNDTKYDIYLLENDAYTLIATDVFDSSNYSIIYANFIEYDDAMHLFVGGDYHVYHYVWNGGSSVSKLTKTPYPVLCNRMFVIDNNLYGITKSNGCYMWKKDVDEWEPVTILDCPSTTYESACVIGRKIYIVGYRKIYEIDWDAKKCVTIETNLFNGTNGWSCAVALNGYIYFTVGCSYSSEYPGIYKYDVNTRTYKVIAGIHENLDLYLYNNRIWANNWTGIANLMLYEITE